MLYEELTGVLDEYKPDEVAIESVFVNSNGHSTMKLCMARGVVMLVPGIRALRVAEYSATQIKKTLTGQGHASKSQVRMMVNATLSWRSAAATQSCDRMDAADALAVAICHERYSHIKTFNLAAS
jgi:crossover junction endodeoxyribonuclease RuvC